MSGRHRKKAAFGPSGGGRVYARDSNPTPTERPNHGGPMSTAMRRFTRTCMICGGEARVLAPEGSDELDVEAEFSSAARALGDDNETVGVACYRCAEKVWRRPEHACPATHDSEEDSR